MNGYRWLTDLSRAFLERDYLLPGQTVDQRVDVIGGAAGRILGRPGYAARFKEYFRKGWFSLSTPIWTNFGCDRGLPISCFGSYISDSMASIAGTWAEVAMMTKYGGGTSAYFGELRPRGSKIRDNGESSGAVHFMQPFDTLMNVVSQGGTRRGNFAAYLPIDHPDIREFLTLRSEGSPIQDMSFGVCVPDAWMESMIAGDVEKRAIWAKVLESRQNIGYPYIVFADTANRGTVDCYKDRGTVDCYKDRGLRITHSNLCVTGDQLVVTSNGMKRVVDLYESGESLTLFDGMRPVSASPMRLIKRNAEVYQITTTAGRTHKVTGYHKVKTRLGMVAASDLKPGDRICFQYRKGLFGTHHDPGRAFLLGHYQGDGTQDESNVFFDLWEHDFDLIQEMESSLEAVYEAEGWTTYPVNLPNRGEVRRRSILPSFRNQVPSESGIKKKRMASSKLFQAGFRKGAVPQWIWDGDEETQAAYLRGLFYTDGSVTHVTHGKGDPIQVQLPSTNMDFLREIQIMLGNFGIKSAIHPLREAGDYLLPDGDGGRKLYACKAVHRLIISNKPDALQLDAMTGLLRKKGVVLEDREYRDNTKKFDEVRSVELVGREDVYCTTVDSDEHVWVCNGIVTSNCSEIMLPDGPDESFVCDLSSMNLLYFDEWKGTDAVEVLVCLLDAVMTEFIEKASKIEFMERPVRFARRHRALGVGVLGWHSYLQSRMIPFESMEAKFANVEMARTIREAAYAASAKLAAEFGEPEVLQGYGRRNTTLMAIAPTKSSAFILGQVSEGIEPHRSNYYIKDLAKGKFTIKNEALERLLREKGLDTDEVWSSILKHGGSVQHLDVLTERERSVFKTFAEISPREVVIQAAQRQKYIDQSQSLNLMIAPSVPIKDVNALMIEAWRLGVKSLYYQIGVNAAQQFSRNILACASCEA